MEIDEKISLTEYDENWTSQFEAEKGLLQSAFPEVYIEHVGSTAVGGMTAKPIIDILIGVLPFPPSEAMITGLEKLGYYHFGEHNTAHARLYFVKRGAVNYNVHVDQYEGERWKFMIAFRDYLRSHPDTALEYSNIKQRIIDGGKNTMLSYSNEKMKFIEEIIENMNAAESVCK